MKKLFYCLLLLPLLTSGVVRGQNLVRNPGFEEHNSCPYYFSDVDTLDINSYLDSSSFTHLRYWVRPTGGTPDYFNTCDVVIDTQIGVPEVGVPLNFAGYQQPHTGNAYAGFYANSGHFVTQSWIYAEYLESELIQPFITGHHYYTSFYVSFASDFFQVTGNTDVPSIFAIDQLGALFSDTAVYQPLNPNPLLFSASIKNPAGEFITDSVNWTKIDGIYTAAGNEQWIVIGRFFGDQVDVYQVSGGVPNSIQEDYSYYYLDDVCVLDLDGSPASIHDTSICPNTFPVTISGLPFSNATYVWNTGDTTASISINSPGTYWRKTKSGCALYMDTIKFAPPPPGSHTDTFLCSHNLLTLSMPAAQAYQSYLWNTGDTTSSISVTESGTYIVSGHDVCGAQSDTFFVNFSNYFMPSSGSVNGCDGGRKGKAWVKPHVGDTTTYIYTWTDVNGNVLQIPSTSSMIADTLDGQDAGIYTVTMQGPNGCDTTIPITLNFYSFTPTIGFFSGCYGSSHEGKAWICPHLGDTTTYTYTWTDIYGDILQPPVTSSIIADTLSNQNFGIYNVTMKGANGCDTSISIIITAQVDSGFIHASDTGMCIYDTIKIYATGGISYHWQPDNRTYISDTSIANPQVSPQTDWSYVVYGINSAGCLDTAIAHVRVFPNAVMQLPDSVVLYYEESYQFSPATNCSVFNWFPPLGLSADNISNPIASPPVDTKYIVTGTTEEGCTIKDSVNVYRSSDVVLTLPNAFTPGNGPNNLLKPIHEGDVTLDYLRIFNRWGRMIYESSDPDQGWDGTWDGKAQPAGVYIYTMEGHTAAGRRLYKQGNITLIK